MGRGDRSRLICGRAGGAGAYGVANEDEHALHARMPRQEVARALAQAHARRAPPSALSGRHGQRRGRRHHRPVRPPQSERRRGPRARAGSRPRAMLEAQAGLQLRALLRLQLRLRRYGARGLQTGAMWPRLAVGAARPVADLLLLGQVQDALPRAPQPEMPGAALERRPHRTEGLRANLDADPCRAAVDDRRRPDAEAITRAACLRPAARGAERYMPTGRSWLRQRAAGPGVAVPRCEEPAGQRRPSSPFALAGALLQRRTR
eukprot:scaffold659_cov329-Prasinococcus_capsulatus_cf.AAC.42